jgi:hypothetical protein
MHDPAQTQRHAFAERRRAAARRPAILASQTLKILAGITGKWAVYER